MKEKWPHRLQRVSGWQGRTVKNLPDRKSTKSKENMGIFVLRYAQLSVEVETALLRILAVFILFLADRVTVISSKFVFAQNFFRDLLGLPLNPSS